MKGRKQRPVYTVEQYLALERATAERNEFLDGVIYLMAGESLAHGDIAMNLSALLHAQLRGTPCRPLAKDTKVVSGPKLPGKTQGLFSYPDLIVVCGDPQFHDEKKDVITNPTVIIEILSPSTELFDRGEKCRRYQTWNDSLKEYVLVSQDRPLVERFSRQPKGGWLLERFAGLDATMPLESIGCSLPLHQIYERVAFAESAD